MVFVAAKLMLSRKKKDDSSIVQVAKHRQHERKHERSKLSRAEEAQPTVDAQKTYGYFLDCRPFRGPWLHRSKCLRSVRRRNAITNGDKAECR